MNLVKFILFEVIVFMFRVTFHCDYGDVSGRYKTEKEINVAWKWFYKKNKFDNPSIKSIKEIIAHGSTKSK